METQLQRNPARPRQRNAERRLQCIKANAPLLAMIESFLASTGMGESTFGRRVLNDWALIRDLRRGRHLYPDSENRIRTFMTAYRAAPSPGRA